MRIRNQIVLPAALLFCSVLLQAQVSVRGQVELEGASHTRHTHLPSTVVWLTPATGESIDLPNPTPPATAPKLVQKNKSFQPHLLVVPVGSVVEFPNHDPFFHNVFSLFEGKRFDLGLYEAGTSRLVHFDRVGISYIFCNIHPEMSAVVITLGTPLYSITNRDGQVNIPSVPAGRYILHIWSEHGMPENSQTAAREVTISETSASLGAIRVPGASAETIAHKNKYGRDYDQPTPDNPVYRPQR